MKIRDLEKEARKNLGSVFPVDFLHIEFQNKDSKYLGVESFQQNYFLFEKNSTKELIDIGLKSKEGGGNIKEKTKFKTNNSFLRNFTKLPSLKIDLEEIKRLSAREASVFLEQNPNSIKFHYAVPKLFSKIKKIEKIGVFLNNSKKVLSEPMWINSFIDPKSKNMHLTIFSANTGTLLMTATTHLPNYLIRNRFGGVFVITVLDRKWIKFLLTLGIFLGLILMSFWFPPALIPAAGALATMIIIYIDYLLELGSMQPGTRAKINDLKTGLDISLKRFERKMGNRDFEGALEDLEDVQQDLNDINEAIQDDDQVTAEQQDLNADFFGEINNSISEIIHEATGQ